MLVFREQIARFFTRDEGAIAFLLSGPAWPVVVAAQPLNSLVFITDGLIYAVRDFRGAFLSMFLSFALGFLPALGLFAGIVDKVGVVPDLDREEGPQRREATGRVLVCVGQALQEMVKGRRRRDVNRTKKGAPEIVEGSRLRPWEGGGGGKTHRIGCRLLEVTSGPGECGQRFVVVFWKSEERKKETAKTICLFPRPTNHQPHPSFPALIFFSCSALLPCK